MQLATHGVACNKTYTLLLLNHKTMDGGGRPVCNVRNATGTAGRLAPDAVRSSMAHVLLFGRDPVRVRRAVESLVSAEYAAAAAVTGGDAKAAFDHDLATLCPQVARVRVSETGEWVELNYGVSRLGTVVVDAGRNRRALTGLCAFVGQMASTREVAHERAASACARRTLVVCDVHLLSVPCQLGMRWAVERAARTTWVLFTSCGISCVDAALRSRFLCVSAERMDGIGGDDGKHAGDASSSAGPAAMTTYDALAEALARCETIRQASGVRIPRELLGGARHKTTQGDVTEFIKQLVAACLRQADARVSARDEDEDALASRAHALIARAAWYESMCARIARKAAAETDPDSQLPLYRGTAALEAVVRRGVLPDVAAWWRT